MVGAADRLLQFIGYKGFGEARKGKSLNEFYKSVGLSIGTIKPERSIGSDILTKISLKYPELNMDWVVSGRGKMLMKDQFDQFIPDQPTKMIVGTDGEAAKIAVDALKQENADMSKELNTLHRKLLKCIEEKDELTKAYKNQPIEPNPAN